MTELEFLALEAEKHQLQGEYLDGFVAGFKKAREMAFHQVVQWANNPSIETMKDLLSLGEKEIP